MRSQKVEIIPARGLDLNVLPADGRFHAPTVWRAIKKWMSGREMTFEEWERIERKYSPHSSHHAQIYFRERGL